MNGSFENLCPNDSRVHGHDGPTAGARRSDRLRRRPGGPRMGRAARAAALDPHPAEARHR